MTELVSMKTQILTKLFNRLLMIKFTDGFHNLLEKSMIFDDVAIAIVEKNDYRILFWITN